MVSLLFLIYFRVPKLLKDRRTRPYDVNTGTETIYGMLKFNGRNNLHKYSIPNIHNLGLWTNISIDDFYQHWGLVNEPLAVRDIYMELVDTGKNNTKDIVPMIKPVDDAIKDETKERGFLYINKNWERFSFLSTLVFYGFGLMTI